MLPVGCSRQQPVDTAKAPTAPETVAVSHWTNKTELFMEHQPLVAGAKHRFAVHLRICAHSRPLRRAV
jgi:hypothetical protein